MLVLLIIGAFYYSDDGSRPGEYLPLFHFLFSFSEKNKLFEFNSSLFLYLSISLSLRNILYPHPLSVFSMCVCVWVAHESSPYPDHPLNVCQYFSLTS